MKKSKFLLLTTLSPIISLPFLSASCITGEKADNKMEKDIKINENTDEKNSSETMNDKQKQNKSSIDSKMEEKADKDSSKSEEGKSMENEQYRWKKFFWNNEW
nr:variable surface lipoprotein [Mycoplasmopsis bovis]